MTSPFVVSEYVTEYLETWNLKWAKDIVIEYMNPTWRVFYIEGDVEPREWEESTMKDSVSLDDDGRLLFQGKQVRFQTPSLFPDELSGDVVDVLARMTGSKNVQRDLGNHMWEPACGYRMYNHDRKLDNVALEVAMCQNIPCVVSFVVTVRRSSILSLHEISYWMQEHIKDDFPFLTLFSKHGSTKGIGVP